MKNVMSLTEYAKSINAELRPTCLADMPVKSVTKSSCGSFGVAGEITSWIQVIDHSGGVNKTGLWPFSVQEENGKLTIVGS